MDSKIVSSSSSSSLSSSTKSPPHNMHKLDIIITKQEKQLLNSDIHNFALNVSISKLEKVLTIAAAEYYNSDNSILTDAQFDILQDALRLRDPLNKILKQTGAPIEGDITGQTAVKLPYWLGSMDKIKPGDKRFDKWINDYKGPYILSDKLDGISGLIVIKSVDKKPEEINLYTRGDGEYGQNITKMVKYCIPNIKDIINNAKSMGYLKSNNDIIAIRGELIIKSAIYNEKYVKHYQKARSLVAGCVNAASFETSKSFNPDIAKHINFIAYEVIFPYKLKMSEQMDLLCKLGITVVRFNVYNSIDLNISELSRLFIEHRGNSEYEIDGIIVCDDSKIHERNTSGNPVYAFAFKMPLEDQTASTRVEKVEWNISKTGAIKPTIVFNTVIIGGDNIRRATGFNAAFIENNKLGPGAEIEVIKSGDVIPYITRVIKPALSGVAQMPDDIKYKWNASHIDIMADISTLTDEYNLDYTTRIIANFFKVLGVKGIGSGIIAKLVENGHTSLTSMFKLRADIIANYEGFGLTCAKKIVDAIQLSIRDPIDIATLAAASNIFPGIGEKKFNMIIKAIPNFIEQSRELLCNSEYSESVIKNNKCALIDLLVSVKGIGPETSDIIIDKVCDFIDWLDENSEYIKYIDVTKQNIKQAKNVDSSVNNNLFVGASVVLTGFRDDNINNFIELNGGVITSGVSSKTTLLIVNDITSESSKMKTAKEKGIKIITKDEFYNQYKLK